MYQTSSEFHRFLDDNESSGRSSCESVDITTHDQNSSAIRLSAYPTTNHQANESCHTRASSTTESPLLPSGFTRKRFSGWRVGVTASAVASLIALFLNVGVAIGIAIKFGMPNGIGTLFHGSCKRVESLNFWIHMGINALSTVLLGGSNYCMQCLSAPTRKEVNVAHAQGKWLDIGVPSMRNLKSIAKVRLYMWLALGLSAVPLHLMFNSAVFGKLATNGYYVVTVAKDFRSTPPWQYSNLTSAELLFFPNTTYVNPTSPNEDERAKNLQDNRDFTVKVLQEIQRNSPTYEPLPPAKCISEYSQTFLSTRRHVILVTSNTSSANGSFVSLFPYYPDGIQPWMCNPDGLEKYAESDIYRLYNCVDALPKNPTNVDDWRPDYGPDYGVDDDYGPVEHCLSERVPEACSLQFSLIILLIVIACNLCKTLVMVFMAFRLMWQPLITVGDGVASFLAEPDETTRGACLVTAKIAQRNDWTNRTYPFMWIPKHTKGFETASRRRWLFCNVLLILNLAISAGLLGYGLRQIQLHNTFFTLNVKSLWELGFGAINQKTLIKGIGLPAKGTGGLISSTLLANLPQAILSFLYLIFNGLCTCMLLAQEWNHYAHNRKPLRVSSPIGRQRSTYFLQLPYKYAIPLLIVSGTLHWFVSQSIFLASVESYDPDGVLDLRFSYSTCGYSPMPIIGVIILGSLLVIFGLVMGSRTYEPGIPLAASCSIAISAACHVPEQELELHPEQAPLQWGVVPGVFDERGNPHCSFSSQPVTQPVDHVYYS